MSWFKTDKERVVHARRDAAAAKANPAVSRGPVIRASDFSPRPASLLDAEFFPQEPVQLRRPNQRREEPVPEAKPVVFREPPAQSFVEEPLEDDTPLLDTRSVVRAIWHNGKLVIALAVLGALLGGAATVMLPRKYSATASLYFDPRQIQLNDNPATPTSFSRDAFLAVIDSQTHILLSKQVLEKAAVSLQLDRNPAFSEGMVPPMPTVIANLQKAAAISREDNAYVVNLTVVSKSAVQSAEIANQIVSTFLREEDTASAGIYRDTSSLLDGRLDELGQRLQEAEKSVETYKADNDMVSADGSLIADKRLVSLNELLVTAQTKTIEAKAKADAVSKLRFEDMLAGSLPDDVTSAALADLRRQYGATAANVKSLESQLGSRHPQLLAAKASLDGLSGEIRRELQRFVSLAKADLEQAQKAEADVAKELAVQKATQNNSSIRQVELKELERRAAAARDIYETMLKRTRQTSEEENLTRSNIRVISAAEPPLKADGPGNTTLLVAGIFGGFLFGAGLAVTYAVLRMMSAHPGLRGYLSEPPRTRRDIA
ncbi:GumC family protein [Rhizobium sp. LjRoot30]|uniref:GumC family protein n=1 Tax=Rhizobium sp. LjRoot30 TaxID=3342320 RepID=UPI003ECCE742